jgi:hypothetical protein
MKKLLTWCVSGTLLCCAITLSAQPIPVIKWDIAQMSTFIKNKKQEPPKGAISNSISVTVIKCNEVVADNKVKEKVVQ